MDGCIVRRDTTDERLIRQRRRHNESDVATPNIRRWLLQKLINQAALAKTLRHIFTAIADRYVENFPVISQHIRDCNIQGITVECDAPNLFMLHPRYERLRSAGDEETVLTLQKRRPLQVAEFVDVQFVDAGQRGHVFEVVIANASGQREAVALKITTVEDSADANDGAYVEAVITALLSALTTTPEHPHATVAFPIFYCCSLFVDTEHKKQRQALCREMIGGQSLRRALRKLLHANEFDKAQLLLSSAVFRILHALGMAHEEFGFVHGDLHLGNVMLTPLDANIDDDRELYTCACQRKWIIPTVGHAVRIMDFGMSSISRPVAVGHRNHTHQQEIIGVLVQAVNLWFANSTDTTTAAASSKVSDRHFAHWYNFINENHTNKDLTAWQVLHTLF